MTTFGRDLIGSAREALAIAEGAAERRGETTMTPADYVREIVIPTVEEFRNDRTSRRRAYLATIATFHVKDYLKKAGETDVENRMRALVPNDGFDVVRAVCNGTKHFATNGGHLVAFVAGTDWERPPAAIGLFMIGVSRIGDVDGGREIAHDGRPVDLYEAVQATLSAFIAAYPAQLAGLAQAP